jgi:hypothetical protein
MLTPSISCVNSNPQRLQIDFGKVFLLKEINNHTYIVLDISHSENTSSTIGQKQHGYLKLWYFSGKMFATLVLIIFPTLVLVSQVAFEELRLYFIKGLENGSLTIQYVNSNIYIYYIIIYFQYSVFLITLAVFPPFPAPHSTEKYFRIRGFENAVLEYEFVRHILLVTLVLLITILAFTIILPFIHSYFPPPLNILLNPGILNEPGTGQEVLPLHIIYYLRFYLFIIVVGAFLKILFALAKAEFRLYFAIGCFRISQRRKDEGGKMRYLIKGLNSYNKYLKRCMNLQMEDLTKIYSKISSAPQEERKKIIESLSDFLERGNNTLEPVRYLLTISKVPEEEFLIEQPLKQKIKEGYTLLIPVFTIIVTLITSFLAKH